MNALKMVGFFSLLLICTLVVASPAAHAGSNSPSQPPGEAPYGMAIHGDAGGTKLSGTITLFFSNLRCADQNSSECIFVGPDLAYATAAMQLKKSGGTYDAPGSSVKLKTFSAMLGEVHFKDAAEVQLSAEAAFRCDILKEFFNVEQGECGSSTLEVLTKSLSEFSESERTAPTDPFSVMATLVLAVK